MIDHVETVSYGRPATEVLRRAIAQAKAAGPLHPVTVVVESNLVGLSLRRLLGSGALDGSGVANVNFLTPFHLAELLAPSPHDDGQPLTNPVLAAAVRRVLRDQPGPLASVAEHPATEAAVAALYADLSHVSPATLDHLEQAGGITTVSVGLHRAVAGHLAGLTGEAELAWAVANRADLADQGHRIGTLIWFLPGPLTASLERVMRATTSAFPSVVITALTGDADADTAVVDLARRFGLDLEHRGQASGGDTGALMMPHASDVISVSDPDEEVRAALRWVMQLADDGVALGRIGIFFPTADPYARVIRQHLFDAGIPGNGPSHGRLADSAVGRTLVAALELPSQQWRRDRVMALVATAPVRNGDEPVRPGSWETLSRMAGVVQGLGDWSRKIAGRRMHLAERRHRIEAAASGVEPGSYDPTVGHPVLDDHQQRQMATLIREDADLVELGAFVEALADRVGAVVDARTWHAKVEAARVLLVHLLGSESRRVHWPEPEQEAATQVLDVLSRLSLLDELDPEPSHAVFVRALTAELEVGRGREGRFGEGVMYGPLSGAPGHDLDAVVVLGLAEGLCPARRRDDSLLPDTARALAPAGELPLRAANLSDQHRSLLAALASAPPERRLLLYPRGSQRSNHKHLPSRWLLDSVSARAGRRIYSNDFHKLGEPLIQTVVSHATGVRSAPVPLSLAERDLGDLATRRHRGISPHGHPGVSPAAGRGMRALAARLSSEFTAWDGNLAGQSIPSPTRDGALLSATGLEGWATCGFRYFLSHVLDLSDRDDPERIHRVQGHDRGTAVHEILERFFLEVLAEGPPDPDTEWTPAQRRRAAEIAVEELDALEQKGRTGRPVLWRLERERLLRLVDTILDVDNVARAERRATPERVELPFGLDGAGPVTITMADGRSVQFRGKADRVDRTEAGHQIVLDYKTGGGKKFDKLHLDPFNGGTTLQLGLYAEAARQRLGRHDAAAYYWMVEQAGPSAFLGYHWTDALHGRFLEVVGAMVEGIDGGVFPLVPGDFDNFRNSYDNCRYCDFDRLCPADRGDYAEAKVDAPQLRVRNRLVPAEADTESTIVEVDQ